MQLGETTADALLFAAVLKFLRRHEHGVDVNELAERFDRSTEQMLGVIDFLWTLEVPEADGLPTALGMIDFDAEGLEEDPAWVKLTHDPFGEIPVELGSDDLATVLLGLEVLEQAANPEQTEQLDSLSKKLREIAADKNLPVATSPSESKAVSVIHRAASAGRQLQIDYRSEEGDTSSRLIDPLRVLVNGDLEYLNAYCYLRRDLRWFRTDRILNAVETGRAIGDYSDAQRNRPLTVAKRGMQRVDFSVTATGLAAIRPYLAGKQVPAIAPGARSVVTVPVRNLDVAARLVAASSGNVVVAGPPDAREYVFRWLRTVLDVAK